MSDQPEPLAAILAEMRAAAKSTDLFNGEEVGEPLIRGTKVVDWADRIEEAAKRKQASLEDALSHCREFAKKIERENEEGETRLDAEEIIATVDNEFAGIRPERAPGNAAAMREALEQALAYCESDQKSGIAYSDNDVLVPMLRAALAAPARNCDRFQNWHDAMREEYFTRSTPENVKGYPYGDDKRWREFCDWLFAPAEGGDHA